MFHPLLHRWTAQRPDWQTAFSTLAIFVQSVPRGWELSNGLGIVQPPPFPDIGVSKHNDEVTSVIQAHSFLDRNWCPSIRNHFHVRHTPVHLVCTMLALAIVP